MKGKLKLLIMLLMTILLGINKKTNAQYFQWASTMQEKGKVLITTQTVDNNDGSVYMFGETDGDTLDLDPGLDTFNTLGSDGAHFIQKLNRDGKFVWGKRFGPSSSLSSEVIHATTDNQSNMYMIIKNNSNQIIAYDANTDTGDFNITPINAVGKSSIITKYDNDGKFKWALNFPENISTGNINGDPLTISFIKTDAEGNVYVGGSFFGESVDLNPGPGEALFSSLIPDCSECDGGLSGFLLKLDKEGKFKWVVVKEGGRVGVSSEDNNIEIGGSSDLMKDMTTDDAGNIIVVGSITMDRTMDKVDLNPGTALGDTFYIPAPSTFSNTLTYPYLMKLNSEGQFIWGNVFNDSASFLQPFISNVFLNKSNDIYLSGDFRGTVDFDLDTSVNLLTSSNSDNKIVNTFLLKLDQACNFQWVKELSPIHENVNSYTIEQGGTGKFYLSGSHKPGTLIDYNPEEDTASLKGEWYNRSSYYEENIIDRFVASYDAEGNFLWVKGIEQKGIERAVNFTGDFLTIDRYDNLIFSGQAISHDLVDGFLDADPSPSDTVKLFFNTEDEGSFIFKWSLFECDSNTSTKGEATITACNFYVGPSGKVYDASGTYIDSSLNSIGCDSFLTIYLTINKSSSGTLNATACNGFYTPDSSEFFSTPGIHTFLVPNGSGCDSLVTLNLTLLNSNTSIFDTACESYISPSGKIWTVPGLYRDTIANSNGCDSILFIDLTLLEHTEASIIRTSCGSYTSPSGKYIWTRSGVYFDTVTNKLGCDSILFIRLSILNLDLQIDTQKYANGTVTQMSAREDFSSYQWLDCTNNYEPINGANQQSFIAESEGSYAVDITRQDGCRDTSVCLELTEKKDTTVGIYSLNNHSALQVYPNPANHYLYLKSALKIPLKIRLLSMIGQLIMEESLINEIKIDVSALLPGQYMLMVEGETSVWRTSIIKE